MAGQALTLSRVDIARASFRGYRRRNWSKSAVCASRVGQGGSRARERKSSRTTRRRECDASGTKAVAGTKQEVTCTSAGPHRVARKVTGMCPRRWCSAPRPGTNHSKPSRSSPKLQLGCTKRSNLFAFHAETAREGRHVDQRAPTPVAGDATVYRCRSLLPSRTWRQRCPPGKYLQSPGGGRGGLNH